MWKLKPLTKQINNLLKRQLLLNLQRHQHTAVQCSSEPTTPTFDNSAVKPAFRYAVDYCEKVALHDRRGEFTYKNLFLASWKLSKEINKVLAFKPNQRVAFLCPNDASYVIAQWASWMSGQTVVPLSKVHPPNMLEYYITDSDSELILTTEEFAETVTSLSVKVQAKVLVLEENLINEAMSPKDKELHDKVEEELQKGPCPEDTNRKVQPEVLAKLEVGLEPEFYEKNAAMIIYTSGTTGPPKGVVVSHKNIHAQINSMVVGWNWCHKDIILHTLPLHHVHGITNALLTPLSVGAKVVMLPEWNAADVWSHLLAIKKSPTDRVNIFMGVPTMYSKLIQEFDTLFASHKRQVEFIKSTLSTKIRLMISGSAPLPEPILTRWREISGHTLLERYGMSETGMVLSNPLEGERRPGTVGQPLPGVQTRIVSKENPEKILCVSDENGATKLLDSTLSEYIGDLQVKGPTVFSCYWNKPNATAKEFTKDGWFKTGDTACFSEGYYKIMGRTSVDIIKTGGYKVSALDVETALLCLDDVRDVAVLGVADVTWGEKVAAVVALKSNEAKLELPKLREWCKERLPPYAVPTVLRIVDEIPRNAMGKINKKELLKTLFPPAK